MQQLVNLQHSPYYYYFFDNYKTYLSPVSQTDGSQKTRLSTWYDPKIELLLYSLS